MDSALTKERWTAVGEFVCLLSHSVATTVHHCGCGEGVRCCNVLGVQCLARSPSRSASRRAGRFSRTLLSSSGRLRGTRPTTPLSAHASYPALPLRTAARSPRGPDFLTSAPGLRATVSPRRRRVMHVGQVAAERQSLLAFPSIQHGRCDAGWISGTPDRARSGARARARTHANAHKQRQGDRPA